MENKTFHILYSFVRDIETDDEWNLRIDKQLIQQRKYHASLPEEKRSLFRERERIYRQKHRDGLSEDKKDLIRRKENQSKKMKRDSEKTPKRPYNEKETFYLKPMCFDSIQRRCRLEPVQKAGSYIQYLLNTIDENIKEKGDWKWMYNTMTKETIMASEFETLAKKYAVVFQQIGLHKGDVVHFFMKCQDHVHTYPAMAGLWIIGAIGTFGNFHKWTNTHETYQTPWARGMERYKSELELQFRQVT